MLPLVLMGATALGAQPPDGRVLFGQSCSIAYCHGPDGGDGRAPSLRGGLWSRESLTRIIEDGVPDTSMPPFGDRLAPDEVEALVSFILSMGAEASPESANLALEGAAAYDLAAGRALFYEGRCATCHRFGRDDHPGPDLTATGEKSPITILRDILEPGRSVKGAKPVVRMRLRDGRSFDGIVEEETETFVRVHDLSIPPYVLRRLPRTAIDRIDPLDGSAMPSNLADGASSEALRDLVFFIRAGGDKDEPPEVVRRDAAGPGGGSVGTLFLPVSVAEASETLPAVVVSGLGDALAVYVAAEGFAVLSVGDRDPESAEMLAHLRGETGIDPDRIATWTSNDASIGSLEAAIARFREQLRP